MDNIKVKKSTKEWKTKGIAAASFITVFVIQAGLNTLVPCMRSLPDEMGAVALAAKAAGYHWDYVLTHPSKYYGSGTFPLLYPFFIFIKNPLVLYQFLLGVGAFLHAVPAYISCRIVQKYYRFTENQVEIYLLGIACSFFTPTRASNIDNEPMLIMLCWMIVYLVIALQNEKKSRSHIYSALLSAVLVISCLSHTRALIYSAAIFIVIVVYWIFTKKILVNLKVFLPVYLCGFTAVNIVIQFLKKILFTYNSGTVVINTPGEVMSSAAVNIRSAFSKVGLQSIIDLLLCNIWIIFVFGFGILLFCAGVVFSDTIRNIKCLYTGNLKCVGKDEYFPMLFCVAGILLSLAGVCVIWLPNAMGVHLEETNLSRGHFYLRYYGNYFGPLFLFFIIRIRKAAGTDKGKLIEKTALIIAGIMLIMVYILNSFLEETSMHIKHSLDWFYYFAPFSGNMDMWPETLQDIAYFICSTLICTNIYVLIIVLSMMKKQRMVLIIVTSALLWQYSYGVVHFDSPYASSENYYQSVNAFYKLSIEETAVLERVSKVFYCNATYGPEYIVQFMLPEYEVITDMSLLDPDCKNIILLSDARLEAEQLKGGQFSFVQLDKNEFLYLNDQDKVNLLKKKGYVFTDANS